jgi:hydroxymethylpyrimidine pyrophosphatase-like HAD family hydrolase
LSRSPASSASTPRLLAVDLDGTLLDARGVPHEVDVRALRALAATGVHVSILTGRLYSGTRASAMALGLTGPVGCVDGSHVVNASTHTTMMHHAIKGDHAIKLRDSLARSGPATFLFARDVIVHDDAGDPFLNYVTTWSSDLQRSARVVEHEFWEEADGLTAVVSVGTVDQIGAAVEEIQKHLPDAAQVAMFPIRRIAGAWGLVVRAIGGNKGSALAWLADHHGLAIEETVCVGDWLNDLAMFKVAGRAFAMGQAPDELKLFATDLLEENVESGGGIARVVRDHFGVKF